MPEPVELVFVVPPDGRALRLDRFLTDTIGDTTRSVVQKWIREGRVSVAGSAATKSGTALEAGQRIVVRVPPPVDPRPRPEEVDFSLIYEDDSIAVLDKPAGVVVHPGHGHASGTLVHGLLGRGLALSSVGAPDRPGIVHRLDRGTSGVMVVAKSDAAHHALADAFAQRAVEKHYMALVWGHPDPDEGTIDRPLGRSRNDPTRIAVHGSGGRPARTRYRTRERIPGFSLLDLYPETGRTHQIRVHLQSIHHPIVGDTRYAGSPWRGVQHTGKRAALKRFPRLWLHAADLAFRHPDDDRELQFHADPPRELLELLELLRSSP